MYTLFSFKTSETICVSQGTGDILLPPCVPDVDTYVHKSNHGIQETHEIVIEHSKFLNYQNIKRPMNYVIEHLLALVVSLCNNDRLSIISIRMLIHDNNIFNL